MKSFELQPHLSGDLVQIRPMKKEEFEPLYAVASDPLIWELHPEKERYRRDIFQKYFDGAIQSAGAVVIEDKNGNIIGASRYYDCNFHQSQITIGYTFLGRKYWGGQFNLEVKKLMLNHAFKFVDRVIFEIGEKNLRSRRAIEKIGAKMIQGKSFGKGDQVIYQMTREEFQRNLHV
ncbi:MAG: putative acetyltransferase [Oligoflexia bacterium]|nr:MAG: putative acetyltransferase [Oligoflexia bacterium]